MFGHPGELAQHIEVNQCVSCTYKNYHGSDGDHDFLMCHEIEVPLVLEGDWPDEVDKHGVCLRYRYDRLDEESHPDQGQLPLDIERGGMLD